MYSSHQQTKKSAPAAAVNRQKLNAAVYTKPPVRLVIDGIHVDATIKPVGLTKSGDMAIDSSTVDVAWYMGGPKPGDTGSAVIAGHYGWKNDGSGSVFNDLHSLKQGDKIATYDRQGDITTFVTQRVQQYDMNADTTEIFHSKDGKAHLNLITCDRQWNNALKTYSQRLVVFTNKDIK